MLRTSPSNGSRREDIFEPLPEIGAKQGGEGDKQEDHHNDTQKGIRR